MKALKLKGTFLPLMIFATILLTPFSKTNAQTEFLDLLTHGTEDANYFAEQWFTPMLEARGVNMNNGWYVSGHSLKLGRFEVRLVGLNTAFVPKENRTFDVDPSKLTYARLKDPAVTEGATFFGKVDNQPELEVLQPNDPTQAIPGALIKVPNGVNVGVWPNYSPQLSIGLVKGTEIMGRFMPKLKYNGFEASNWGFGLKHNVLQHLPLAEKVPTLAVSAVFTYSFSDFEKVGTLVEAPSGFTGTSNYDDQTFYLESKAFNFSLVASTKLPVVTFFGGLNYQSSNNLMALNGTYPVLSFDGTNETLLELTNPVGFEVKHSQFSVTGGTSIKLGIIRFGLSGSLAPGGYSSAYFSFGMGFMGEKG